MFLSIVFFPLSVQAASLSFFPSIGEYAVGSVIPVSVYVSSSDKILNAASGVISFPTDKLEVVSVSKQKSIITFWVQGPAFLNTKGRLSFEGIVFNPGFRGERGEIVTINFRVKAEGRATLTFVAGSALANDGLGTNILSSMGKATYDFVAPIPIISEATTTTESTSTPSVLIGTPLENPSVEADVNNKEFLESIKFDWRSPLGVELLKFILLILVVILLILILLWALFKTSFHTTNNKETTLHVILNTLKETLQKEVLVFEKMRSLPEIREQEKRVIENLSKEIDKTEELIRREIEENRDSGTSQSEQLKKD